jgi:hypothetical protein
MMVGADVGVGTERLVGGVVGAAVGGPTVGGVVVVGVSVGAGLVSWGVDLGGFGLLTLELPLAGATVTGAGRTQR